MGPNPPEAFITKEAVAKRLGLTPAGVKSLLARRVIPVYRLGHRTIRFRWSEVEEAIARFRQTEIH